MVILPVDGKTVMVLEAPLVLVRPIVPPFEDELGLNKALFAGLVKVLVVIETPVGRVFVSPSFTNTPPVLR